MQSCGGCIYLLPALPDECSKGHVRGLRAKGGFTVDMNWIENRLSSAEIYSSLGGELRLRTNSVVSITCEGESVDSRIEDGAVVFNTEQGKTYTVNA